MIVKPMLAVKASLTDITFPCIASNKLDGIRCLISKTADEKIQVLSRSLKPIRNKFVVDYLTEAFKALPVGTTVDGELLLRGDKSFNEVSSGIMSGKGEPDFIYCTFDYCDVCILNSQFTDRLINLASMIEVVNGDDPEDRVIVLPQTQIGCVEELTIYYSRVVEAGGEGLIVRSPDSPYKHGRSTLKEGYMLKLKPFLDSEFEIVGFGALEKNLLESTVDALGHKKKAQDKNMKEVQEALGYLICKLPDSTATFGVGSGFDMALREQLWKERDSLVGKIAKVRYMNVGLVHVPRHPVFLGFRDIEDTSSL